MAVRLTSLMHINHHKHTHTHTHTRTCAECTHSRICITELWITELKASAVSIELLKFRGRERSDEGRRKKKWFSNTDVITGPDTITETPFTCEVNTNLPKLIIFDFCWGADWTEWSFYRCCLSCCPVNTQSSHAGLFSYLVLGYHRRWCIC